MANSAAELRDLARQIGHSAFSIAYPIIVNACNHLRTAARPRGRRDSRAGGAGYQAEEETPEGMGAMGSSRTTGTTNA